ncbi:hypothetical protein HYT00_00790 [Candidatus Giovannonibacteria bacterium]|nr:hypothetical protein [Candidatus Giovannonibacteria bacterium]
MEKTPGPEQPPTQEEIIQKEALRTEKISSNLLNISTDREKNKFYPLLNLNFDLKPYIKEIIPEKKGNEIQGESELRDAQNKTISLIFESAAQIAMDKKSQIKIVRDDPNSLMALYQAMNVGQRYYEELSHSRPEEIKSVLENLLIKSKRKEKPKENEIIEFSKILTKAQLSLRKRIEALRGYQGR